MKQLLFAVIPLFSVPGLVLGHEVGETVVVRTSKANRTSSGQGVASVPFLSVLTVQAVDGDWIRVEWKNRPHWIHRRDTITFARAIQGFSKAINEGRIFLDSSRKGHADAYEFRARLWLNKGNYGAAIRDLNLSTQVDPADPAAYLLRGNTWLRLGKPQNAASDYRRGLELEKDRKIQRALEQQLGKLEELSKE